MTATVDVAVVGAGIAGVSVAWRLARAGLRVVVCEQEQRPAHHATGRSASVLNETSGHPVVCALASASRPFLTTPPEGFCDHPLLSPRGLLWIGTADDGPALDALAEAGRRLSPTVRRLDADGVRAVVPQLRDAWAEAGGCFEPDAMGIDAAALVQGYVRGLKAAGGELAVSAEVVEVRPAGGGTWAVRAGDRRYSAGTVVDAAGAWGDVVAERAGLTPIGLTPYRRTAALVPAPDEVRTWPLVMDVGSRFYCEPEAGGLLISPAEEQPSEPCDATHDELDVALALERIGEAFTVQPRSVRAAWAGLRTFAPDRVPVAGRHVDAPGFVWLVGQGGAGIKTAPALAEAVTAIVTDGPWPETFAERGLSAATLAASRFG